MGESTKGLTEVTLERFVEASNEVRTQGTILLDVQRHVERTERPGILPEIADLVRKQVACKLDELVEIITAMKGEVTHE